jgi:hypothetical protein
MRWKSVGALGALGMAVGAAAIAVASANDATSPTNVSAANTKAPGYAPATLLSPELQQIVWAQGSYKLENPDGQITSYGYLNDGPMTPAPSAPTAEASKTEPDKNTYLVFRGGLKGPDPSYNYGTHFLYQGHEGHAGYVTRINLDADGAHRVTLLADKTADGQPLKVIDGSTWDPFASRLLFTVEQSGTGGVYQATPDYRPRSTTSRAPSAAAASREFRTTTPATSTSSRTPAARTAPARMPEPGSRTASSTGSCRTSRATCRRAGRSKRSR